MLILYPPIKPYAEYRIKVEPPHELYVEESGSKDGIPVLFLHGGPGSGSEPFNRRFFDPQRYRIILFDQRGCGRSTPHASLENNHTKGLLEDIEVIRNHFNIEQWMICGGSWGATLALTYAQTYPEHVLGMVLRGVFLFRDQDINWFYKDGASRLFPDAWADFSKILDECDKGEDIFDCYLKRLTGADELARMAAAKSWAMWEGQCTTLRPNHNVVDRFTEPHTATSLALVAAHFMKNKGFLKPNQILDNASKLKGIPGIIVHGRYDIVCPLEQSFALNNAWTDSELHIVRDAGHSSSEPSIVDGIVRATDTMAKRLTGDFDKQG
jgi:proline iminopeptidase